MKLIPMQEHVLDSTPWIQACCHDAKGQPCPGRSDMLRDAYRHRWDHKVPRRAATRDRMGDLGSATVRAHADGEAPEGQKPETPSAVSASTSMLRAVARSAFPFSRVRTALSKIARLASHPSGVVP